MARPTGTRSVITIARTFGSGGVEAGRLVAQRLGYYYADRVVLALAARRLGLSEKELSEREEHVRSFWDDVREVFALGPMERYTPGPLKSVSDQELFAMERHIMKVLAERHDCVVIGRGGRWAFQGHPRAVHVLLHASLESRVPRVMQTLGLRSEEAARRMIEDYDRARTVFRRRMTNEDPMAAGIYHLCIDTGGLDLERVADLIVSYQRAKYPRP